MTMTKTQAKQIEAHALTLQRIAGELADIRDFMQTLHEEQQEKFDAKSERWQESDAGETAGQINEHLEAAASGVEEAETSVSEAADAIAEALAIA